VISAPARSPAAAEGASEGARCVAQACGDRPLRHLRVRVKAQSSDLRAGSPSAKPFPEAIAEPHPASFALLVRFLGAG